MITATMRWTFCGFVTLLLLLGVSPPAQAQTGPCPSSMGLSSNPTRVCVSLADDAAVTQYNYVDPVSGAQEVFRVEMPFYIEGVDPATGTPVQTLNLGKPPADPATRAIWAQP